MQNYNLFNMYSNPYNREVLQDLKKINKQIEEAETGESNEDLTKLRMAKLMRGMFLQGDTNNNKFGYKPY